MSVVVVVDDEPMMPRLMVRILNEGGFQVYAAPDALRAVEMATRLLVPPDIHGTDVRMESVDEVNLAKLVVRCCPSIQVLYVSGFDAEHLSVAGKLLMKPFSPAKLVEAVRDLPGPQALASTSL